MAVVTKKYMNKNLQRLYKFFSLEIRKIYTEEEILFSSGKSSECADSQFEFHGDSMEAYEPAPPPTKRNRKTVSILKEFGKTPKQKSLEEQINRLKNTPKQKSLEDQVNRLKNKAKENPESGIFSKESKTSVGLKFD